MELEPRQIGAETEPDKKKSFCFNLKLLNLISTVGNTIIQFYGD